MKIDTLRHTGDHDGIRVSAWIEAYELAIVRNMRAMLADVLTALAQRMADEYFNEHKAELLAGIDVAAITEQVQADIAARLSHHIVALFPAPKPQEERTDDDRTDEATAGDGGEDSKERHGRQ